MKDDQRPPRYSWAPGNYMNRCITCKEVFAGEKRASLCADCAYALPDSTPLPQEEVFECPLCHNDPIGVKLKGTFPVVLFLGSEADRQELIREVLKAKPGMKARAL